jgi:hypothetical protein
MIQALHLFLLLIISIGLQGQGVIGVVEYLNVKNQIAFLEVEKEVHPVYRVLIDQKGYVLKSILNACCLYSNQAVLDVNAMVVTVAMRLVLCFIFSSTRNQ